MELLLSTTTFFFSTLLRWRRLAELPSGQSSGKLAQVGQREDRVRHRQGGGAARREVSRGGGRVQLESWQCPGSRYPKTQGCSESSKR